MEPNSGKDTLKKEIHEILNSEHLSERFFERFGEEFMSDNESAKTKFAELADAYLNMDGQSVNEALMALCGWTFKSLVEFTVNE